MLIEHFKWLAVVSATLMLSSTIAAFAETAPGGMTLQEGLTTRSLEVATDSAIVLESDEAFSEMSVANPKIADISTISSTALYILGKQPGRTTIMLIRQDGSVMSVVNVRVAPDITELERRLGEILPGEDIDVLTANDGLVLSGVVSSAEKVTQALELAGHYAPGKISNLITVEPPKRQGPDIAGLRDRLAQVLEGEAIGVNASGDRVVLSGSASSELVVKTALGLAEAFAPGAVTSELAVAQAPVVIEVDAEEVRASLHQVLSDEQIGVHELGGTIVLSGTVSSQDRLSQALQVARLVAGDTRISSLLTVEKQTDCRVRTRKGGEMIEIEIPCRTQAAKDSGAQTQGLVDEVAETEGGTGSAEQFDLAQASELAPRVSPLPRRRPAFE